MFFFSLSQQSSAKYIEDDSEATDVEDDESAINLQRSQNASNKNKKLVKSSTFSAPGKQSKPANVITASVSHQQPYASNFASMLPKAVNSSGMGAMKYSNPTDPVSGNLKRPIGPKTSTFSSLKSGPGSLNQGASRSMSLSSSSGPGGSSKIQKPMQNYQTSSNNMFASSLNSVNSNFEKRFPNLKKSKMNKWSVACEFCNQFVRCLFVNQCNCSCHSIDHMLSWWNIQCFNRETSPSGVWLASRDGWKVCIELIGGGFVFDWSARTR